MDSSGSSFWNFFIFLRKLLCKIKCRNVKNLGTITNLFERLYTELQRSSCVNFGRISHEIEKKNYVKKNQKKLLLSYMLSIIQVISMKKSHTLRKRSNILNKRNKNKYNICTLFLFLCFQSVIRVIIRSMIKKRYIPLSATTPMKTPVW